VSEIPGIVLQGGEEKFQCRDDGVLERLDYPDTILTLLPSGDLQVETTNQSLQTVNSSELCLYFTTSPSQYDTDDWEDGSIKEVWAGCSIEEVSVEEQFTKTFYPTLIFISSFFIFATLVIYCILKENRSKLFGKLTIGFLLNVFVAFFFTGVHYSLDTAVNKYYLSGHFCRALGYIIQHFWLAFFFWMSAMAINITNTFAQSFRHGHNDHKQTTMLVFNILYAQGIPVIITIVTLIMDNLGRDDLIVPIMGQYSCFLDKDYDPEDLPPFYKTPIFLYFYLFISIVMTANLICFLVTVGNLVSHWMQMKEMEQSQNNNGPLTQFRIIASLFFIMGIPWLLEISSAAVEHQYGRQNSFSVRLTLDILSLVQGILIFIVLVCKGQVMKKVKTSLTSTISKTVTSKTSISSLSATRKASAISRVPKSKV